MGLPDGKKFTRLLNKDKAHFMVTVDQVNDSQDISSEYINNVPEQGVLVEIASLYKKIISPRRAIKNACMA